MRPSASLCALLLAACEPTPPPGPDPEIVLVLDGIEVRRAELQPLVDYLGTTGERLGRAYRIEGALERHILPMKLAQRAFAAERAALRAKAEAMHRSVVASGNAYPQLRSKGEVIGGVPTPGYLARHQMELAQAMWCFAPENLGWCSPVLEVPQGFCMMAVQDYRPGETRTMDGVDAYLVPFFHHDRGGFDAWYKEQKKALAGRLQYVHPDYADGLPRWIMR